ncbi:hypothetical protein M3Y98_01115000 [Aphelenchoides besseyi]|nr:hypothetical protein M3Y98_01115000 [Aphelenchoides besseyi]
MCSIAFLLACTSWSSGSRRSTRRMANSHAIPSITISNLTPPTGTKRLPSTDDGRFFTIIDETSKDSDSFDETASSDDNDSVDQSHFSRSCYISSVSSPHIPHMNYSAQSPKFNLSASRFKIVPVETHYKRGRWSAYDFYLPESKQHVLSGNNTNRTLTHPQTPTHNSESTFHLTPPPTKRVAQRPFSTRTAPLATPEPMSTHSLAFEFSDGDSDRENSIPTNENQSTMRRIEVPNATNSEMEDQIKHLANLRENLQQRPRLTPPEIYPLSGRITPSEMLHQYGLERSLSATATPFGTPASDRATLLGSAGMLNTGRTVEGIEPSSGIVSGSSAGNAVGHPLNGTPIVAIDSKIEQAMDLVKTHLMFAVREEVEHLRSRIMELETTVVHLEAENSILREHVPSNVIQSLSLQTNSTQSGTTTMS